MKKLAVMHNIFNKLNSFYNKKLYNYPLLINMLNEINDLDDINKINYIQRFLIPNKGNYDEYIDSLIKLYHVTEEIIDSNDREYLKKYFDTLCDLILGCY